jgi:hypothetical protein
MSAEKHDDAIPVFLCKNVGYVIHLVDVICKS